MLASRRPHTAFIAGFGLIGCLLQACASPGATPIVGPDGSAMAHVHCGHDQGACFRLAGELCPGGYELKPVMQNSDGNFLVRCRAAKVVVAPQQCGAVVAAASPGASNSGWPPASEPWPAAYPWPPPETTAGALPPPQNAPGQEVDLGY